MSKRKLFFLLLSAVALLIAIGIPTKTQLSGQNNDSDKTLIAGRNVNMVSGTTLPGGDPWLQRQNEPSIAVSTRNPLHLLAGANDYRTVDMPESEGELPGITGTAAGDAWVGVYKSFDGGESWTTTLLPGFPQDSSSPASPLKGYTTAADPIVRAGTNGLFYYSGIAFNRLSPRLSAAFVARYIDNNNSETLDPIKYLDTKVLAAGNEGQFIDMPSLAVDMPRGSSTIIIDGQTIPASNVYLVYSIFLGNLEQNIRSKIYFIRSTDCGQTWGNPIKITESVHINQGARIAIDPTSGAVYVAWRRFAYGSDPDAIMIVKSTDGGQTFTKPSEVSNISPFDQPATDDMTSPPSGTSFRTNSYPSIAIDDQGRVYCAWSQRGIGPAGESRIVLATSADGIGWSLPQAIVSTGLIGHQFMPSLTFSSGRLILVWYDQCQSVAMNDKGIGDWINDDPYASPYRQTIDVFFSQAEPGQIPIFETPLQVSQYLWALKQEGISYVPFQAQFNPPNYPLFKGGTTPFHGDYIDIAPSPPFVKDGNGSWRFNTSFSETPVFHLAWTDNRDVRPPDNNDWKTYNPPTSPQNPPFGPGSCADPSKTGMRNQNIYTSRLTREMVAASILNTKPLGTVGYFPADLGGGLIPRAFAVYVKNTSDSPKSFRLKIIGEPSGGNASFLEFEDLNQIDIKIASFSTVARTVFAVSAQAYATVTIEVAEIFAPGGGEVPDGLRSIVVLNEDPTTPPIPSYDDLSYREVYNPNIVNPSNPNIVNPNIVNWTVINPNIVNPNIVNPNIVNPNIVNPNIVNPNIVNPNIVNPNIVNPNIVNPNIVNPNIVNPNIVNPNIVNPNIVNAAITDATWQAINTGNTTATYTLKLYSKQFLPAGIYTQLLVYRTYYTPAAPNSCELKEERHDELLLNVMNPNIVNPNIVNPNIVNPNIVNAAIENATFSVAPGEKVYVNLRLIDENPSEVKLLETGEVFDMQTFAESLGAATTAHAVNTEDAVQGITTPPTTATKLVIGTSSLPDGIVGTGYSAKLQAFGGTPPYAWCLTSGELPPGLNLAGDTISGTPSTAGLYYFIVRVDDSGGDFDAQRFSIYIDEDATPDDLTITTTSLPNGVLYSYYGATLEATGGVWPRTWRLTSGSLPPGLMLDSGGVISGIVQKETGANYPKGYSFSVVVTDKNGVSSPAKFLSIYINLLSMPLTAWAKTYGGPSSDWAYSIQHTSDGGYIVAGSTSSYGEGSWDFWVLKLDGAGAVVWQKTYGGSGYDVISSIQQTSDGGYIVAGTTSSFGAGSFDFWVLKLNGAGDVVWQKTCGGSGYDVISSIQQTSDGGYIVAGRTSSYGAIGYGLWVLKLDGAGAVVWQKTYGGSVNDETSSFQQTSDGGYIVAGTTYSPFETGLDFWVLKLDGAGAVVWKKTYGGPSSEWASSIQQTSDSGYIVAGTTLSFGAGDCDFWVLKLDGAGAVVWQKTYGGPRVDWAYSMQQTSDSGYIVAGYTYSFGAGSQDFWVLKLDGVGDIVWQKTYGGPGQDGERSIQQTSDGGYIVAGTTSSFGAGGDVLVLKLRPDGSIDPSCSSGMGAESTAIPGSTSVTPSTSTATVKDSAATITSPTVIPADTSAVDQTQCESAYEIYEFVTKWGSFGSGDGQFNFPFDVAVDSSGNVYVTDSYNDRIQKFTSNGDFVTKWGSNGSADSQFKGPFGIAVDSSGYVYVTDSYNDRIQKFTSTGTFLGWWGLDDLGNSGWHNPDSGRTGVSGTGDGEFDGPTGIAVEGFEFIYVADTWNYRIQKFNSSGAFQTKWGSSGEGDGQFYYHMGIAVDSSGNVYVADTDHHRIQKFTSTGTFLGWWGLDDLGNSGWHDPDSGRIGVSGTGDGEFWRPIGIAVDSSGNVYVADFANHRIQKFTSTGNFVTKWGSSGTGDGDFKYPMGIVVDSSGNVYVAEYENHRIQKFRKK